MPLGRGAELGGGSELIRNKQAGLFERSSVYLREAKPAQVLVWVSLLIALLASSGVAMLVWRADRRNEALGGSQKCSCVAATITMCNPRSHERLEVSRSCDCPEYEDAVKLSARGWVECPR